MKKLSPAIIGIITGAVMILISIGIFSAKGSFENKLQYFAYAVYILGIIWAVSKYNPPTEEQRKFKSYFNQAFKCYIVVTLLMVIFTFVFLKLNPQMKTEMATNYKAELEKGGNLTPAEIDARVQGAKDYYVTMLISVTSFGYLIIGSLISLVVALFFSLRKVEKKSDF